MDQSRQISRSRPSTVGVNSIVSALLMVQTRGAGFVEVVLACRGFVEQIQKALVILLVISQLSLLKSKVGLGLVERGVVWLRVD